MIPYIPYVAVARYPSHKKTDELKIKWLYLFSGSITKTIYLDPVVCGSAVCYYGNPLGSNRT